MKSNRLKLLYEIIKFKCLYFHENWDSVYYLLMEPNPLLPITRESSLRSSAAAHSFSLGSPQYTLATTFACFNFHIKKTYQYYRLRKEDYDQEQSKQQFQIGIYLFGLWHSVKDIQNFRVSGNTILLREIDLLQLLQRHQSCKPRKNYY